MWDDRFRELLDFRRQFGHVHVPRGWLENPSLARWVINLRRQIRTGTLLRERRRLLEEHQISWPTAAERHDARDRVWDRRCDALRAFRKEYGHCDVPCGWPEDPGLGAWVARQRHLCRAGALRDDRRRRLADAGLEWSQERGRSRSRDREWDRMCDALAVYRREHGDCKVPKGWREDPKLARWVVRQRRYLRSRTLRPDRRQRLEELGVDREPAAPRTLAFSDGPRELAWQKFLKSLAAFREQQGHCNVPRRCPWNPKLGRWVHYQRELGRRGLLSGKRKRLLDALGFQWLEPESALRTHSHPWA
jgi:hypothetical protein